MEVKSHDKSDRGIVVETVDLFNNEQLTGAGIVAVLSELEDAHLVVYRVKCAPPCLLVLNSTPYLLHLCVTQTPRTAELHHCGAHVCSVLLGGGFT